MEARRRTYYGLTPFVVARGSLLAGDRLFNNTNTDLAGVVDGENIFDDADVSFPKVLGDGRRMAS